VEAEAYRQFLELERTHWWFRGRRTVYLGVLRHHLAGERPERALDLGTGLGGFLPGLSELCDQVFPSDTSHESLVHVAERGYPNGVASSGYALPYRDEAFDLVCLLDCVEHIEDDLAAMKEVRRVLRPGGLAFLSVPAYQFLYANNDRVVHHHRRYSRRRMRELLEGAGLEVERNTHTNVFLFPAILPAVLGIKALERLQSHDVDPRHTNLSWPIPAPVHGALHAAFAAELPFTRRFDWPAGHSIAAIARRPTASAVGPGTPPGVSR
jgi:SAM-dependent methyltransferase